MGISVVHEFHHLSGTYTSMIDIVYNLRQYFPNLKLKVKIGSTRNVTDFMKLHKKCVGDFSIIDIINEPVVKDDVIIISQEFSTLIANKLTNLELTGDYIIILDSASFLYGITQNRSVEDMIQCFPKGEVATYYLCNPKNLGYVDNNGNLYYHKFSRTRLNFIKDKMNMSPIINFPLHSAKSISSNLFIYENIKYHKDISPWQFNSYVYTRWFGSFGTNIENIGKLIHEFRWLEKPVYYCSDRRSNSDGLTYYLKLFGVDDTISQYLTYTSSDIEQKLFMSKDDLLLQLCRGEFKNAISYNFFN